VEGKDSISQSGKASNKKSKNKKKLKDRKAPPMVGSSGGVGG